MKTILVDAINGLFREDGTIFEEMYRLLESYANDKIVLTGANDEQYKKFHLDRSPYEVFTLKHNPEKTDPEYFKMMLDYFSLKPKDVVYLEHNREAAKSAESIGIRTFFYDHKQEDLVALKKFIDENQS